MITASISASAKQAASDAFTMGSTDVRFPKADFTEAVLQFFAQMGRTQCEILDGALLIQPQWEYTYRCTAAGSDTSAPEISGIAALILFAIRKDDPDDCELSPSRSMPSPPATP